MDNMDKITLYSKEFDDSVDYYVYYPENHNETTENSKLSKLNNLSDRTICRIFDVLLKKFSINNLIDMCPATIFKGKQRMGDSEDGAYDAHDKYEDRYCCDCYNWICDGCLEDENKEIKESIIYPINKRFIIESYYDLYNSEYIDMPPLAHPSRASRVIYVVEKRTKIVLQVGKIIEKLKFMNLLCNH